jgi:hypothetical protein
LKVFHLDEDTTEKIWNDDDELLKFGYQYVKTVLKLEQAMELETKTPLGPGPGATTLTF